MEGRVERQEIEKVNNQGERDIGLSDVVKVNLVFDTGYLETWS